MENRALVGQCVPPGQKRMQEIAERKRQRQEVKNRFGGEEGAAAMRIQRAIRKYQKRKERAAQRAADRAPREGRTRSQNEPRRSVRLRGG